MTKHPRREISRQKVLNSLKKSPRRFGEICADTKLTPAGLNEIRKILLDEKQIEHTLINGKEGYSITKKGRHSLKQYPYLAYLVDMIYSRGGIYRGDYSTNMGSILSLGVPWGIQSEFTCDKELKKLDLLSSKDVLEIEEMLFQKITKNLKKKKLNKTQIGDIVLGFTINYNDLLESIQKQSFEYVNNLSKTHMKLLNKYENDPESMTKKELERMWKLREETYEKIKSLDN